MPRKSKPAKLRIVFEETGEVRKPEIGEWYYFADRPILCGVDHEEESRFVILRVAQNDFDKPRKS